MSSSWCGNSRMMQGGPSSASNNAMGRREFQRLVGSLDEDAQTRVLVNERIAEDEGDAKHIIATCSGSPVGAGC